MTPPLERVPALKASLPFRLGTTSFIYPDHILPNVRKLGHLFDEIELLIFESNPLEYLPDHREISELARLSRDLGITYNVHLPVDVSLAEDSRAKRDHCIDTLKQVMDLVSILNPTTHTLHLELPDECLNEPAALGRWQERTGRNLLRLCHQLSDPGLLSIETLNYPFELVDEIVEAAGVNVCLDAGHLMLHGRDVDSFFKHYASRIPLIHLHGIDFSQTPPRDHLGLEKTPPTVFEQTLKVLTRFTGTVSLEVFNLKNLETSVIFLETCDFSS